MKYRVCCRVLHLQYSKVFIAINVIPKDVKHHKTIINSRCMVKKRRSKHPLFLFCCYFCTMTFSSLFLTYIKKKDTTAQAPSPVDLVWPVSGRKMPGSWWTVRPLMWRNGSPSIREASRSSWHTLERTSGTGRVWGAGEVVNTKHINDYVM